MCTQRTCSPALREPPRSLFLFPLTCASPDTWLPFFLCGRRPLRCGCRLVEGVLSVGASTGYASRTISCMSSCLSSPLSLHCPTSTIGAATVGTTPIGGSMFGTSLILPSKLATWSSGMILAVVVAKSLYHTLLCWCWRYATRIPPGTDSACSGCPFPSVIVERMDMELGALPPPLADCESTSSVFGVRQRQWRHSRPAQTCVSRKRFPKRLGICQ